MRSCKYHRPHQQPRARNKGCAIYDHPVESGQFPLAQSSARGYYLAEKPHEPFVSHYNSGQHQVTPSFPLGTAKSITLSRCKWYQLERSDASSRTLTRVTTMIPIVWVSFSKLGLTRTRPLEYVSKREDTSCYHQQEATPGSSTRYWQEALWSQTDYLLCSQPALVQMR